MAADGGGWGNLLDKFKREEGSWRCDACFVWNKPKILKCIACETDNPTASGEAAPAPRTDPFAASAAKKLESMNSGMAAGGSSSGNPGFMFGSAITSGGFSFGSVPPAATSSSGGGFHFPAAITGAGSSAATSGSGFSFPAAAISSSTPAGGGFSFPVASSASGSFSFGSGGASVATVAAQAAKPVGEDNGDDGSAGGEAFSDEDEDADSSEDEPFDTNATDEVDALFTGAAVAGPVSAKCVTGVVACVGTGDCGQLGLGEDKVLLKVPSIVPVLAKLGSGRDRASAIVAVAAGGLHNAALSADGELWTWGCNDDAVLGRAGDEWLPGKVAGLSGVVQVACSDTHTAALTRDGVVYTWGTYKDGNGYLGYSSNGDVLKQAEPCRVDLSGDSGVAVGGTGRSSRASSRAAASVSEVSVAERRSKQKKEEIKVSMIGVGAQHTVALAADGRIFCWGSGEQGQLARKIVTGRKTQGLEPRSLGLKPRGDRVIGVYAGGYVSFAVTAAGRLYAWGLNNFGQLGLGDNAERRSPALVAGELAGQRVVQAAAGEHHSLALTDTGKVYAFGRSDSGQLGIGGEAAGKKDCSPLPVRVPGLPASIVYISAGDAHSMALAHDGTAFTWGFGDMYQLGSGRGHDERKPYKVKRGAIAAEEGSVACRTTRGVTLLAGGGQHSIFLLADGRPALETAAAKAEAVVAAEIVPSTTQNTGRGRGRPRKVPALLEAPGEALPTPSADTTGTTAVASRVSSKRKAAASAAVSVGDSVATEKTVTRALRGKRAKQA